MKFGLHFESCACILIGWFFFVVFFLKRASPYGHKMAPVVHQRTTASFNPVAPLNEHALTNVQTEFTHTSVEM